MDYTVPDGLPADHEFEIKEDTSPDPPPRKPRPRRPVEVWNQIRHEYLTTSQSIKALGQKYSIPEPTIRDKACRAGWAAQRRQTRAETNIAMQHVGESLRTRSTEIVESVIRDQSVRSSLTASRLIRETLDDSSDWLQHIRVTRGDPGVKGDPASIRALVSALRDVVGIARTAHGLDKVEPVSVSIGLSAGIVLTPTGEKVIEVESAECAKPTD